MQKNDQLEDIIIQKNTVIEELQNKVRQQKANTATETPSNTSQMAIKTKVDTQHPTDHNALHTHQVGVMNKFIHLTHNEDLKRQNSTTTRMKDMPQEPKTVAKTTIETEKTDEDPTFTLVTKRKMKHKNVPEERTSHQQRPKTNQNVGKAPVTKEEEEKGFAAKKRKIWLHISRAKEHVTEKIVTDYLAQKTGRPVTEFMVKLLPTQKQKKDNNCFMVGVDPSLKDEVYKPEFWPHGIVWTRFNFFRGRRFLQEPA